MKILFGSRQQGMSPTHSPISGMQEMQGTYTQLSGPHPRGTQEEHKSYISNMAKRHPFFLFILFLPKLALVNYFQDHFWWDWIFVIDNILNAKYSECTLLFNCELLCTTNTQEAGNFVSNSSLCLDLYFIYTAV